MKANQLDKDTQSKTSITNAACYLFANIGYHETTMQHIAEAAGFSKGGVYYYFNSKEDVLYEIHDKFIQEGIRRLRQIESSCKLPEERLNRLFAVHLEIIHEFKDDITLFLLTCSLLSGEKYEQVKKMRDTYEDFFLRTVEQGIADGVFETEHARVCTLFILGSFNFMHMWYNPQGPLGVNELTAIVSSLLMLGLKKRAQ